MNKFKKLLNETYVLTGEGKLNVFKAYLRGKCIFDRRIMCSNVYQ